MAVSGAYLGVILIWATTPLAIQWSSGDVSFQFGLATRMIIGLVIIFLILRLSGLRLVTTRNSWPTYFVGGLSLYMAMSLVYLASEFISSGWVSVIFGLTPVVTSIAHQIFNPKQRINHYEIGAALLGVTGLVVMFVDGKNVTDMAGVGILIMLLSVFIHAVSAVWIKHLKADLDGITITAGSLLVSTPLFFMNWVLSDEPLPTDIPIRDMSAILYLGIFGSAIGFSFYYFLIKHITVRAVALITLITPVIALWLGHTFNGETMTQGTLTGTFIILISLLISQWGAGNNEPKT